MGLKTGIQIWKISSAKLLIVNILPLVCRIKQVDPNIFYNLGIQSLLEHKGSVTDIPFFPYITMGRIAVHLECKSMYESNVHKTPQLLAFG